LPNYRDKLKRKSLPLLQKRLESKAVEIRVNWMVFSNKSIKRTQN
jgi:hypothetical protein